MSKPYLILGAAPLESSKLKNIFEGGRDSIIELLRDPGQLRYAGWDLQTLDSPRIIKGKYLEVNNGDRKIIRLYEDGAITLRGSIDDTFLGWGQRGTDFLERPHLNPIAIVELTCNFVNFYKQLLVHFETKPALIRFIIQINNAFLESNNKKRIYLTPYVPGSIRVLYERDPHYAPESDWSESCDVDINMLDNSPAHVAYLLIEKLYLWFGIQASYVPFRTKDSEERWSLDIVKIQKL